MKEKIKNIWFYIKKYKYIITFLAFAIWITFIDQTNLLYKAKQKKEIQYLEKRKVFYSEDIKQKQKYYQNLLTNPETKERLARENYFMSKKNEDVFIIVDRSDK